MPNEQAYQANLSVVKDLEPALLWRWFARICAIAHPSHHEEELAEYIVAWASSQGLSVRRDAVGNVIIVKPATDGMQMCIPIALQAHLDMVPQANTDVVHDFTKDAIKLRFHPEDEHWLMATGTTLGADNGIGMASCLALLETDDVAHPKLEVLLTMTEETGMVGAFGLKAGELESSLMVNTDTEEIGEVYIGCAGGIDANVHLPMTNIPNAFKDEFIVSIQGLKGGHSGLDIDKNRGNAIKILARILAEVLPDFRGKFAITALSGGSLRNAIPREVSVNVACCWSIKEALMQALERAFDVVQQEIIHAEPDVACLLKTVKSSIKMFGCDDTERMIHLLNALPSGVVRQSDVATETVETSLSLGVAYLRDDGLHACLLIRSLIESAKQALCTNLYSLATLAGAKIGFTGDYVGWNPSVGSDFTTLTTRLYTQILGHAPQIKVIHAGLECGLIKRHYPQMDIISIGPTIKNAHSPQEMVHVGSVAIYWQLLTQILANAPKITT